MIRYLELILYSGPAFLGLVSMTALAKLRPNIFFSLTLIYFLIIGLDSDLTRRIRDYSYEIEGFSILFTDILASSGLLGALFNSASGSILRRELFSLRRVLNLLLVICLVGIVSWTFTYGLGTAISFWREPLYFGCFGYFATSSTLEFTKNSFKRAISVIYIAIPVYLMLAIKNGIGTADGIDLTSGAVQNRLSTANGAFLFLFLLISLITLNTRFTLNDIFKIILVLSFVLILQHRSVWLSGLAGVFVWLIMILISDNQKSKIFKFLATSLGFGLVLLLIRNLSQLSSSLSSTGTANWRIQRWTDSVSIPLNITERIFGSILGPTTLTSLDKYNVAAHNHYISSFEYSGLIGLFVFGLFVTAFLITLPLDRELRLFNNVLVTSILVFGISYSISGLLVLLLLASRRVCPDRNSTNVEMEFDKSNLKDSIFQFGKSNRYLRK